MTVHGDRPDSAPAPATMVTSKSMSTQEVEGWIFVCFWESVMLFQNVAY